VYIFYSGGGGKGQALLLRRHGAGNVLDRALVFKRIKHLALELSINAPF
jgi:hypothetical protein